MRKPNATRHCLKCGGNLYLDRDYHGWYEQCLQCAYMHDLEVVYENKKPVKIAGNNRRKENGFSGAGEIGASSKQTLVVS